MKNIVAAALAAGLIIVVPSQAQEPEQQIFAGKWVVTTHVPDVETEDLIWTVTEINGKYSVASEGGNEAMTAALGIPSSIIVEFDGSTFSMTSTFEPVGADKLVVVNSGVINGDSFEGTSKFGPVGEFRLTGVRQ